MPSENPSSFKRSAGTAVAAGGAVYSANELMKTINDDDKGDTSSHLLKAAVGAAVAVGAYEMMRRSAEDGSEYPHHHHHHHHGEPGEPRVTERRPSSGSSRSRSSSNPRLPGHTRHPIEEVGSAYSLGKELLGDKNNHVAHLVAEVLGATGLVKDLNARNRAEGD